MQSNVAQLVERRVGEDLAVAQVPLPAEVELGRVDVDAGGAHHLDRLGRHLRPDAVAADHCNLVRHGRRAYELRAMANFPHG